MGWHSSSGKTTLSKQTQGHVPVEELLFKDCKYFENISLLYSPSRRRERQWPSHGREARRAHGIRSTHVQLTVIAIVINVAQSGERGAKTCLGRHRRRTEQLLHLEIELEYVHVWYTYAHMYVYTAISHQETKAAFAELLTRPLFTNT